jgi:hypothetical protein
MSFDCFTCFFSKTLSLYLQSPHMSVSLLGHLEARLGSTDMWPTLILRMLFLE